MHPIDPPDDSTPLQQIARWRIGLLLALLATCVALHSRAGLVMDVAALYVYAILIVAYVVAVAVLFWLRSRPIVPRAILPLTLAVDLTAITALTAFSGGVDSIFGVLYMVAILEAAALSGPSASMAAATGASLAYAAVALVQQAGGFSQVSYLRIGTVDPSATDLWAYTGLRIFAFYLVAILSGHLARRIGHMERQQAALLEHFATGYLAADPEGRVTFLNTAGQRILGCGPPAPRGTPLAELLRTDPPGRNPVSTSLRVRKEFFETACTHWRPDGVAVPLHVTTAFIRQVGHEIGGVMAHFSDQTEVQQLHETLRQQDRLAIAGEFSASLAHEVRNPVAAIRGAAQELADCGERAVDPVERQLFGIILREADQLNHVVTHFLEYARVSVQRRDPVNARLLLEEVLELLRRESDRMATVTVETQWLANGMEVAADIALLKEAFLNVAQNALEAMPDGGTLRITTRPAPRPGLLEVCIEDTGVGMAEEDVRQIFQPFFTKKRTGTGLGLAIVQRIIEAHEGYINVHSRPGAGTQMRIRLPLAE